jgi:hypothetical protein
MKILDCESVESTYSSLESILGVSREGIDAVLGPLDDKSFSSISDQMILEAVTKEINPTVSYDRVFWFHLTRTIPEANFDEGILPLGQRIESVWAYLYSLIKQDVTENQWSQFRQSLLESQHSYPYSHFAHLYRVKAGDSFHWGPYGYLVRDIIFQVSGGDPAHYLRTPEIIEDICQCFKERYRFNLQDAFIKSTKPCVVKFFDNSPKTSYVSAALCYIYDSLHGKEFQPSSCMCFDAEGKTISRDRILKVEFLEHVA